MSYLNANKHNYMADANNSDNIDVNDVIYSSVYDETKSNYENEDDSLSNNFGQDLHLEDDSPSLNDETKSESNFNINRPSTCNNFKFKLDERELDEDDLDTSKAEPLNFESAAIDLLTNSTNDLVSNSKFSKDQNNDINISNDPSENNLVQEQNDEEEEEEFLPIEQNKIWCCQSKHVFILSEAGKPIYTLHGNEVQLITFMGLLQALVSIIECDNENKLDHVIAGDHKFVFLHQSHLIFVIVSKDPEICIEQLKLELNYIYNQIISVVTLSLIEKIFKRSQNYDLRKNLSGTEKLLTNIVSRFKNDFGMLLNCVNSYPLQNETREQISRIIAQQINPIRYVIFGLLLYEDRIVSLIRPKSKNIHPVDVHLLVNVITGLDTPKSSEFTWYPICLPNFDSNGLMYAYISHLDESCKTYLILLTGLCDQNQSSELNECRKRIQQKLQTQSIYQVMNSKFKDQSLRLDQIGVVELKHFLYKDNKIFQYFVSDYALPYTNNPSEQQRIFNIYQKLYHRLHNKTNSLKIIYMQQNYETVLGWITSNFEIYATFSPLITKDIAIKAINKLLEFTQKHRAKIFLNAMPTLQR